MKIPQEVKDILCKQQREQHHFDGMLDGEPVFRLRTERGLPLEVIDDLCRKHLNWSMDLYTYCRLLDEHKEKSRQDFVEKHGMTEGIKKRRKSTLLVG